MLDHAQLMAFVATSDPGRAKGFYRGTLGFELLEEDDFALVFDAGGVRLRISIVDKVKPHPYTVLGWRVPDLSAVLAKMADHGVSFERFPHLEQDKRGVWTAPDGARVAWFRDTDGNVLSISEQPES